MLKKIFPFRFQTGEIATIIALGSMAFILLTTLISRAFIQKPQTTMTKAAGSCPYKPTNDGKQACDNDCKNQGGCTTCVGGGGYTCKNSLPTADPTVKAAQPTSSKPTGSSGYPRCTAGSYMQQSGCEGVCGIGQCQQCDQGGLIKWECIRSTLPTDDIPNCSMPKTYATESNCKSEGCTTNCTQCTLQGAIRYECGGSGPKQCASNEIICGNYCCNKNTQNCIGNSCVTFTPIPTNTPISTNTPIPTNTPTPTLSLEIPTCGELSGQCKEGCEPNEDTVSRARCNEGFCCVPEKGLKSIPCKSGAACYSSFLIRCPPGRDLVQGDWCFDFFPVVGWAIGNCCEFAKPTISPKPINCSSGYTCFRGNKCPGILSPAPGNSYCTVNEGINKLQMGICCDSSNKAFVAPVTSTAQTTQTDNGQTGQMIVIPSIGYSFISNF